MKLYRIWQKVNNNYDTYDSAVVVAKSKTSARKIHPSGSVWDKKKNNWSSASYDTDECSWAKLSDIQCEYVGTAQRKLKEGSVVCSSFNAG